MKSLTRMYDFTAGAMRDEMVRTQGEAPPAGGGGQPIEGDQRIVSLVTAITPGTSRQSRRAASLGGFGSRASDGDFAAWCGAGALRQQCRGKQEEHRGPCR